MKSFYNNIYKLNTINDIINNMFKILKNVLTFFRETIDKPNMNTSKTIMPPLIV